MHADDTSVLLTCRNRQSCNILSLFSSYSTTFYSFINLILNQIIIIIIYKYSCDLLPDEMNKVYIKNKDLSYTGTHQIGIPKGIIRISISAYNKE